MRKSNSTHKIKSSSGDSGYVNINLGLTFDIQPGYWLVTAAFMVTLMVDVVMWMRSRERAAV